jgi:hypothetical protein
MVRQLILEYYEHGVVHLNNHTHEHVVLVQPDSEQ